MPVEPSLRINMDGRTQSFLQIVLTMGTKGTTEPRGAILVHKTLENKYCELTQFTTPDLVALKIKHLYKELIMTS